MNSNFKIILVLLTMIALPTTVNSQIDSLLSKMSYEGDFRFRAEQDWDSRRPDGTFRDDRFRFRYRLRAGATFENKWYSAGVRVRTGVLRKQQDPQLTLGDAEMEFGTLPIGLEKAYFQGKWDSFVFWLGKNTYPFEKSNELFWSDNVFPEGVFFRKGFKVSSDVINAVDIMAGHFVMSALGGSLSDDNYFQGGQGYVSMFDERCELFSGVYLFNDVPNIPDGAETFRFDYSIFHVGTRVKVLEEVPLRLEVDYYNNFEDYARVDSIPNNFKDQNTGLVAAVKYGKQEKKGDWRFEATYAYLERYSAVDIMAQNDWARWDYSNFDSPDGRLTNLKGLEIVVGYMIDKRTSLTMKYYLVDQLVPFGIAKETNSRIRFDIDVRI